MADEAAMGADGGGVPRATFDALAGARALGDIQSEGLRAAGALVDRLVRLVDGTTEAIVTEVERAAVADGGTSATDTWIAMWGGLLERTSQVLAGRVDGTERSDPARIDVGGGVGDAVVAITGQPGRSQEAELWLHNGTAADLGQLTLRCGPLESAEGERWCEVDIDPVEIDRLPARSSRGVLVRVAPVGHRPPGVYRGVLHVAGAPDLWATVELTVPSSTDPEPDP